MKHVPPKQTHSHALTQAEVQSYITPAQTCVTPAQAGVQSCVTPAADSSLRRRALSPQHSFIVEAPAGSGKTTLLVQRFLSLLSTVKHPESILAVTFTRAAAQEMRCRILRALKEADNPEPPSNPLQRQTWELARAALVQDRQEGWGLLKNSDPLKITTIDALCARLVSQMPLSSSMGVGTDIHPYPPHLYQEAVQALFTHYEEASPLGEALRHLAKHGDNRLDWLSDLCQELLAKRDQWLAVIVGAQQAPHIRAYLEHNLQDIEQKAVGAVQGFVSMPATGLKSLADALLTQTGEWRKKIPPEYSELPQSLAFQEALQAIRSLPEPHYTDEQWTVLEALFTLLPVLVAHLKLVFITHQKIDFLELGLNAQYALGQLESPSDLALSLHSHIQHILIDEFQDTSTHQYTLFEQLVRGWSLGDGHTFFLVGDPRQSIYRFRGAEVGLFYTVQKHGLGGIPCEALTLTHNFRASATLVDWVNTLFTQIMPYTPAQAAKTEATAGVVCRAASDKPTEAAYVAYQVQQIIQAHPSKTIAILGRTRAHLTLIVQALQQRNIAFTATELDTLEDIPLIQDLLTLATALQDEHNRIAWLALFRTPHWAMRLSDCTVCVAWAEQHNQTLFEALQHMPSQQFHPHSRLLAVLPILKRFYGLRHRMPFVRLVKALWQAWGGIAAYPDTPLETAELFFSALADYTIINFPPRGCAERLFSQPLRLSTPSKNNVFVMTLHKSKGLEFDVVFIPRLADRVANDAQSLLLLQEYPSGAGVGWLMAPMRAFEKTEDKLYRYLAEFQKKKMTQEMARLLYVGITRAREAVFLSMVLGEDKAGDWKPPAKNSLAAFLWPYIPQPERIDLGVVPPTLLSAASAQAGVQSNFVTPVKAGVQSNFVTPAQAGVQSKQILTQWPTLPSGWQLPKPIQEALAIERPLTIDAENLQWQQRGYDINAQEALSEHPAFGVLIHALLEAMGNLGFDNWLSTMQQASPAYWHQQLNHFGITESHFYRTLQPWIDTLHTDTQLRWILSHPGHCEWALSTPKGVQRLDRVFWEGNTVWVVDYKTSDSTELSEGYQQQLVRYQQVLQTYFPKADSIRGALYYPLSRTWVDTNAFSVLNQSYEWD